MPVTSANQRKFLSLLGIAQKAGRVVTGEDAVLRAIRSGAAKFIVVTEDASANTIKMYTDKAAFYCVPCSVVLTRDVLSKAIGRTNRPALCVTDEGFANALLKLLELLSDICPTGGALTDNEDS